MSLERRPILEVMLDTYSYGRIVPQNTWDKYFEEVVDRDDIDGRPIRIFYLNKKMYSILGRLPNKYTHHKLYAIKEKDIDGVLLVEDNLRDNTIIKARHEHVKQKAKEIMVEIDTVVPEMNDVWVVQRKIPTDKGFIYQILQQPTKEEINAQSIVYKEKVEDLEFDLSAFMERCTLK